MSSGRPLHVHSLIASLDWGGAETLLTDYARGAAELGIEVSVGYLRTDDRVAGGLRELGVEPVAVPITSLLSRGDRLRVRAHLAAIAPDILHTHLGNADLLGGFAARRLGIPAVSTIHIMDPGRGLGLREGTKQRWIAATRRRCAARVIAVSDAARESYLAAGWDRPDHVVTVRNGIADRATPGAGPGLRAELGLGPDDVVAVMVSVLREGKGHELAIEVVGRLRARIPELRLVIVGDGPDRDRIARHAAELGEAAVMTGHRDDVMAILDAADVLLHPSARDAFPTTLLEAAAAGVPVVATAVDGIPEIVDDDRTGLLIASPPQTEALEAAIVSLIADPALRDRLTAAARLRFECEFTTGSWFDRLLPVYEAAIGHAGSPGAGVGEAGAVQAGSARA